MALIVGATCSREKTCGNAEGEDRGTDLDGETHQGPRYFMAGGLWPQHSITSGAAVPLLRYISCYCCTQKNKIGK